jgi:hypothetical protein
MTVLSWLLASCGVDDDCLGARDPQAARMAEAEARARILGMPQEGRPCYLPGVIAHTLPEPRPFRELPQLKIDRCCALAAAMPI